MVVPGGGIHGQLASARPVASSRPVFDHRPAGFKRGRRRCLDIKAGKRL